ncbi:MAG TPA: 2OG-Fe(II) oxygenase, partial [Roseiarcus sp.]|nr:2OG-Fe(II) oxygenase [Roseiarcus sp.]
MPFPFVPDAETIARHFIGALCQATRLETPYRRWSLVDAFPEALCTAILALPIVPPMLGATD